MGQITREDGFTLAELLVVIAILGMVAASVFWVSSVSQQTYTRAASLEDAQLGARAGLDRMATEFRLSGAYWAGAVGATDAIAEVTAQKITFLGDLNADTLSSTGADVKLSDYDSSGPSITVDRADGFAAGEYVYIADGARREVKRITKVSGTTLTLDSTLAIGNFPEGSTGAIVRSVEKVTYELSSGSLVRKQWAGATEPTTGDTIVENVTGLTLTCYTSDGTTKTTTPSDIREIQISLTTEGSDGSRRTMATRVKPRSLDIQD